VCEALFGLVRCVAFLAWLNHSFLIARYTQSFSRPMDDTTTPPSVHRCPSIHPCDCRVHTFIHPSIRPHDKAPAPSQTTNWPANLTHSLPTCATTQKADLITYVHGTDQVSHFFLRRDLAMRAPQRLGRGSSWRRGAFIHVFHQHRHTPRHASPERHAQHAAGGTHTEAPCKQTGSDEKPAACLSVCLSPLLLTANHPSVMGKSTYRQSPDHITVQAVTCLSSFTSSSFRHIFPPS